MTDQERKFESGATRSSITDRYDPEAALSPLVVERYAAYIHSCNKLPDGSLRADDNWQKGIPLEVYMKGAWRHFLHAWQRHRNWLVADPKAAPTLEDDLCALLFNVQGYLHELLAEKARVKLSVPVPSPLKSDDIVMSQCSCGAVPFAYHRGDLPPTITTDQGIHSENGCNKVVT